MQIKLPDIEFRPWRRDREPIQLSDSFGYRRLLRFTLPSILMMIFTSVYGVVDGLFISNYVGTTGFAAVNLIMPFLMLTGSLGFMVGTGGSALVAKVMGEGDCDRANRLFTMMIWLTAALGILLGVITYVLLRPVAMLFGAEGQMLDNAVKYGAILSFGTPFYMLQGAFQSFFVTAERPHLGMWVTIAAGLTNIIGDFLLVGVFRWGLEGAAIASNTSQFIGSAIPLLYFSFNTHCRLHITTALWDLKAIGRTFSNGSSEMVTNISLSFVNILYNAKLMEYVGQNGVAAYGIIMYASFIFVGVFIGYSMGVMPVAGYHYGAGNKAELHNILKRSITILAILGIVFTTLSELFAPRLSGFFVGYDPELHALACRALRIYCLAFILSPFNIFASSYFTALNNGYVSAAISFSRLCLFQTGAILILPSLIGVDGIWGAIVVSEACSLLVTLYYLTTRRHRYGY